MISTIYSHFKYLVVSGWIYVFLGSISDAVLWFVSLGNPRHEHIEKTHSPGGDRLLCLVQVRPIEHALVWLLVEMLTIPCII